MAKSITYEEVLELFKKTARERERGFKEIEREFKEITLKFKETERQFKETDKKIGRIAGTLGSFVEGLVEPKILELFRQRGIDVTEIYPNIVINKKGLEDVEIDLLLANLNYSIAVEIKTTLRVADVNEHLIRLNKLQKNPISPTRGKILLGAIAGMRILESADRYACRKGLFVLKQKGEIMHIANDIKFRPREWIVQ